MYIKLFKGEQLLVFFSLNREGGGGKVTILMETLHQKIFLIIYAFPHHNVMKSLSQQH